MQVLAATEILSVATNLWQQINAILLCTSNYKIVTITSHVHAYDGGERGGEA